ncbi:MAG TPA: class I SAM-dependent methyltransferase [Candidatus Merdenecus merdavium]|nr:class I SAM-dependent methyltransferase [Candidatus Merdenecus merdavium]
MDAYTSFASVYDAFMDNIPYESWSQYVIELLKDYKIEEGILLELGCGTGNMTSLLDQAGFDMIGIDNSQEMLQIALDKRDGSNQKDILYLLQDMREFELYGTVSAVISICDSINYITEEEDLLQVFKLVNNYLDPGGLFIFDLNTIYKYKEILGDSTIAENRDESSFIWNNYYYEEDDINEYELSIFVREKDNLYRKFEETHYQRGYDLEQIKNLLQEAGLSYVTAYDAFTKHPPKEESQRIYVIARECKKKEK